MMRINRYKAAVVQAAPAWLDLAAGVERTIALIEQAALKGARLIVFPEAFLPGYPWYIWLGSPAWQIGRGFVQKYFEESFSYGSPEAEAIAAAARTHDINVILGVSEREGGSLYLGQWLINNRGETVAQRRKLRPTHVERTVYGDGDGSDLAVHAWPELGRVGALCCWEHMQPLSKYAMYSQDEQVHAAAWPSFSIYQPFAAALSPQANSALSRVYALEGSCFVLASCATVSDEMIETLCDTDDKRELLKAGGGHAAIFGPDGTEITKPLAPDEEGILVAEIDLSLIAIAKNAADPCGHYSRADVTRLLFNNRRRRPVEYMREPLRGTSPEAVTDVVDDDVAAASQL